jgi:hypothetical protein
VTETETAVQLLSAHIVALIVENATIDDYWEDLPDVGEDDWARIATAARKWAASLDSVTRPQFEAAYKLLADRADK